MRQSGRCEAGAGQPPAGIRERDAKRQQKEHPCAQIWQQIARRDAASGAPPIQDQGGGLDYDHCKHEIDQMPTGEEISHADDHPIRPRRALPCGPGS